MPGTSAITPQTGAVGSEQVFWIDGNQIRCCSMKDLCFSHRTFVATERDNITWLTSMAVAHPGGQPQIRQNPCRNSSCSRLCLLAGEHGHRCMCPAKLNFLKINSSSQGQSIDDAISGKCVVTGYCYLLMSSYFSFPVVRGRWWKNANFILPSCSGPKGNLNHVVMGPSCCRNSSGDSNNDPRPAPQATPAISTIMDGWTWNFLWIHFIQIAHREKLPSGNYNRSCCWNRGFRTVRCRDLH